MSGIAGIIRFDGAPVEAGLVEKMTAAMAYRGPDGIHHWNKGAVALGQCMLRTTPESLEEIQPLANEDESLVLVMDGRVDNWEELRKELLGRGAVLRTRADAELVLRAYEIWGEDCLSRIDGDFALVIWDVRKNFAFCARDRMGSKPLNYHWNGTTFVFSSEIVPILDLPWVRREANQGVLAEFLAAEWHSKDETFWIGVMRLVRAHCMRASSQGVRTQQYWQPDPWLELPYKRDEEYIDHYRHLLAEIVQRLSRTHRPLAIEVSGGLDSTAVLCVAENLRLKGLLQAPCIGAYTLAFEDDARVNDLPFARMAGAHLNIAIHEVQPTFVPIEWFDERARVLSDFPGFVNATMVFGLLRQASDAGSRIIFDGIGGDEWLWGSREYYAEELAQRNWEILYECFRVDANEYGYRQATAWLMRHGIFRLLPFPVQEMALKIARTVRGKWHEEAPRQYWLAEEMRERISLQPKTHTAPRTRLAGQTELLKTLCDPYLAYAKEDAERYYSEYGLEVRHPLNTAGFVQFALAIPERLRMRGATMKYIHIEAMKKIMPQAILERRIKADFSTMFHRHMQGLREILTEGIPRRHPNWVTRDGMARLFQEYVSDPDKGWPKWILWSIYGCDRIRAANNN